MTAPPVGAAEALFDLWSGRRPYPNDAANDPTTRLLHLPAPCGEKAWAQTARTEVLSQLNGFGLWKVPIAAAFTTDLDPSSLAGHVFLYRATWHAQPIVPGSEPPVPINVAVSTATAWDDSCGGTPVTKLVITPRLTLFGDSNYYVALTRGIRSTAGVEIAPSATWAALREPSAPVVLADGTGPVAERNDTWLDPTIAADLRALGDVAQAWQASAPMLSFLDVTLGKDAGVTGRGDVLLAWHFRTEVLTATLNTGISTSPGALAAATPGRLQVTSAATSAADVAAAFEHALDPAGALTGGACNDLGIACGDVGAVLTGTFTAADYQLPDAGGAPWRWNDPVFPASAGTATIPFIAVVAAPAAMPAPAAGRPVVVFGHDFGGSKESLLAVATALAHAGMSSVAIDWVTQGSRAVRVSSDPARGCGPGSTPATAYQCFAPLLPADAAVARDNLRQSMLDVDALVAVLARCGADGQACAGLAVDPARIGFWGQGFGGFIGATLVSMNPAIGAAVFTAAGVGLVDILTDTDDAGLKCPWVDALIDAGVLTGERWADGGRNALCNGYDWVWNDEMRRYANVTRWIIDPADPANFVPFMRSAKRVLVQEIVGDTVMPDWTVDTFGYQLSLSPQLATPGPTPAVSPGATGAASAWVRYTDPAGAKVYGHASLVAPVPGGALGTAQLRLDAVVFFGGAL
jgi:dienelactone hydrolase